MAGLQVIWLQSARINILVDLIIMYTSITKTKQIINFGTMGVFESMSYFLAHPFLA
jgi:hypothetical protein